MFGRNGEAPVPVIAPRSPGDCFDAAIEAARIALTYRTPVILLSDGYLANGAEPWRGPDGRRRCPTCRVDFATEPNGRRTASSCPTCATRRPWPGRGPIPGTAGLQHRIGGLEKADRTGNISYDPANHDFMTRTRQAKIDGIAASLPPTEVDDPDGDAAGRRHRLGLDLRPDRRRLPAGPHARAARSRRSTCATSTRCRPTSARSCAATTGSSAPR